MTKLRTSLGTGSAVAPFCRSGPARVGTRSERRKERRRARRRKAMAQVRLHWPNAAASCAGKVRRTERDARSAAAGMNGREPDAGMNAYLCGYCGHWHIGHDRRR